MGGEGSPPFRGVYPVSTWYKSSLYIFWLQDYSLVDYYSLPDPTILAREIVESLETALGQFRCIEDELKEES